MEDDTRNDDAVKTDDDLDLEHETPVWKPEELGDELRGVIRSVSIRESKYESGSYPYLEIERDDGEVVGWHASQSVPKRRLAEIKPRVGERIGIRYSGEQTGKTGTSYKAFVVKVPPRAGDVDVDWSALNPAN